MAAIPTYALDLKTGKLVTIETPDLSASFVDKATDTLYVPDSSDLTSLFSDNASRAIGSWSKRIVLPRYETFSWLQVDSTFTDADGSAAEVTVTVYTAAGVQLAQCVVTSREPVRVADFLEREIIVEVTSWARIASVTFASSAQELKEV